MLKQKQWRSAIAITTLALLPLTGFAGDYEEEEEELEFDEAHLFLELNNTDGDLGVHGKIDGDEWKRLVIEDPNERRMMKVRANGRLRRQGITELFFESAEPTFDELDPAVFFKRFPEGTYEIEGVTIDGEEMESETELTHLIPAQPEATVNGLPYVEDCDEDELPVFDRADDVIIAWDPVTLSHPVLGRTNEAIEVVNYELVVEIDDTPWNVSAILPPEVTVFEVPDEILALADEIKYEVLVREESYNQTALESCFAVEGEDDD